YDSMTGSYANSWGRLTATVFHNESLDSYAHQEQLSYRYSHNQAGRVTRQRLQINNQENVALTLDALYEWDNEGRMTKLTYPGGDLVHNYGYDAMGRVNTLNGTAMATYGVAGEMTSFNGDTRTYNSLLQLTRIQAAGQIDIEYRYTAGQNNGRISSQ